MKPFDFRAPLRLYFQNKRWDKIHALADHLVTVDDICVWTERDTDISRPENWMILFASLATKISYVQFRSFGKNVQSDKFDAKYVISALGRFTL